MPDRDAGGIRTWHARVHIYELDSLGHVNNANYVPYLQQATVEAWPAAVNWKLSHLSMEYVVPALHGAELAIHAWVEDGVSPTGFSLGYAIERSDDHQIILRAKAKLMIPSSEAPIQDSVLQTVPDLPRDYRLKPARLAEEMPGGRQFHWQHRVRGYETGRDGEVSAAQVLRWTEEARARAALEVGWTQQRMRDADFVGVVTRHEFEFGCLPRAGDEVEVLSRIYEVRRVRGTWRHEIVCNGQLAAAAFVSGGFLNGAGLPHPPPPELIAGLLGRASG